jgi:Protein of unknown function (DUF998)
MTGWFRIRLGCAAASAAVFACAVIVLGSLTPEYDQWSDAVSRLASPGERWALAARLAFAAYGLLVVAGASTVRQYAGRNGQTLACCLTLYGLACGVAGVAPKDQPGAPHTAVSQVHVAAAVLAGALAIGAMTLVSRFGLTRAARRAAAAMALLTGLAAGVFKFTWGTQVYGVSERVLLGLGMCWISALAIRALSQARRSSAAADDEHRGVHVRRRQERAARQREAGGQAEPSRGASRVLADHGTL